MKHFLWLLLLLLSSCYKEIALPVAANFEYKASSGFMAPAGITFTNISTGAETFEWTFEGGEPAVSAKSDPGEVFYRKSGTYTARLVARSLDGVVSTIEKKILIDAQLNVGFNAAIQGNTFAPVIVNFTNLSKGFDKLEWTFEGGTPAGSDQANPVVSFENGGSHKVSLKVSNSRTSLSKDTMFVFEPELTPEFEIRIPKQYEELEAPVELELINKSVGSISNAWSSAGGEINNEKDKDTRVKFAKAGIYTIQLQAGNGKKTRQYSRTITVKPSKGYAYIKDAELGIFSARNTIGIFYSTLLRQAFRVTDSLATTDASKIDLLFYGLNDSFSFNTFLSPDKAATIGLLPLLNASGTIVMNPAYVSSEIDFNDLDAARLQNLRVSPANGSQSDFFHDQSSKIILFENANHKKGAILIKEFIHDGENSRIRFDIKVLK